MKKMIHSLWITLCAVAVIGCNDPIVAQRIDMDEDDVPTDVTEVADHPRLILLKGEEGAMLKNIKSDTRWTRLHNAILDEAGVIAALPLQTYTTDSRGTMHSAACETVRRVLFLAYAYRTTQDEKYLNACESILLNICNMPSWNPYHFLDVAEFSVAAAFGYDWLYDNLSVQTRATIVDAIVNNALKPSKNGTEYELRWMDMESNWSQVCHGSLAIAATAIYHEEKELAKEIIARSKEKIKTPMQAEYPPMGAYPEGIGYWGYGTALNAMFINVLETYFGAEEVASIKAVEGFMQTGTYYSQLVTNTLNTFAFSDNSTDLLLPEQVIFWFYQQTSDPTLLYYQSQLVDKFTDPSTDYKNDRPFSNQLVQGSYARHLPLMMVWGAGTGSAPTANMDNGVHPQSFYYISQGKNPICTMRSGWDTNDIWLGYKVGNPSCSHGHMDVGMFMFEYGGARFAVDLGSDSYTKVAEANLGGSMFDMDSSSIRWTILHRYNNFVHNTLTVNNSYQTLETKSDFTAHSDAENRMYAVADLTPSYSQMLASCKRAVAMVDKKYIVVEDLLTAKGATDADVVWNMTTKATVSVDASNVITLTGKNSAGKSTTLKLKVVLENPAATPDGITVTTSPVSSILTSYETAAANHYFLRIGYKVLKGQTQRMTCYFLPNGFDTTTSNFIQ